MGAKTDISWCDHTFNPWWGCVRVSPGCGMGKSVGGCYAEAFAKRTGHKVWGVQAPRRFFGDKHWGEPRAWNREAEREGVRHRVFCASMADVFEDRRDLDPQRERLWALIEETPWLDWLLLTKRPENIERLAPERWSVVWPRNIWMGVTAEDQKYYDLRWPIVARVPASVLFVSHEPAIGPLQIKAAEVRRLGYSALVFPNWCITGGESGGAPRPYDVAWARDLIRQTRDTPVAMFVKQMGANPVDGVDDGKRRLRLVDRAGANPGEWSADLRVQQWPRSRS